MSKHSILNYPLLDDADEILTFPQWCSINKLSERTGRRVLDAPGGPTLTMLSKRRIGISRRANREWQASREQS
jgi:hypothetical protein